MISLKSSTVQAEDKKEPIRNNDPNSPFSDLKTQSKLPPIQMRDTLESRGLTKGHLYGFFALSASIFLGCNAVALPFLFSTSMRFGGLLPLNASALERFLTFQMIPGDLKGKERRL